MFNILRKSYIIKEGFWYSFVFMFSQFISLIGAFLVARYLGPHDLGFYTLTQVFMSILSIFLSSFDFYGHWHIVQQENVRREATKYFLQKAIIVGCAISIWFIVTFFLLPTKIFLLTLLLYLPFIVSILSPFLFILQYNKEKIRLKTLGNYT